MSALPSITPDVNWVDRIQPAYKDDGEPSFLKDGVLIEGIYTDVPNDVYHELPALSSTGLKTAAKSLAHYFRNYKSGIERTLSTTQIKTFDTGSFGHELILEPKGFDSRYSRDLCKREFDQDESICFTVDKIKAYLKENNLKVSGTKSELVKRCIDHDPDCPVWDAMVLKHHLANSNKKIVEPIVWDDAHRIQQTHLSHPYANAIIQDGYAELTIIAKCPITGMMLKVKFDYVRPDGVAADVKTSRCAHPAKFARQCADLNYDIQQVFYTYVASLCGVEIDAFSFIVIEYQEADICEVFELCSGDIFEAEKNMMKGLRAISEAEKTKKWDGYSKDKEVTVISLRRFT